MLNSLKVLAPLVVGSAVMASLGAQTAVTVVAAMVWGIIYWSPEVTGHARPTPAMARIATHQHNRNRIRRF